MDIELILKDKVIEAVKTLWEQEVDEKLVQIQMTRREFEGDKTVVVFPFTKMSKKGPEATGEELGRFLTDNISEVSGFNVVKGFLNLTISDGFWLNSFNQAAANAQFGFQPVTDQSELVMIEYSSPNTNKPLHLGHIRNNLLGYSLSEIMKANGYKVVKTNIVNDRGIHICKSMLA